MLGLSGGLNPNTPTWSVGDKPIWEYEAVKDLILARSLDGGPTPLPAPPALTLGALTESLQLMMSSLRTLYESEAGASLKQCIGQVHAAFQRATEITSVFSSVKDHAGFFELITTLVSQVKALTPGTSLVIPGGFKGGLVMFVLHADSFEECTLAVCASSEGLEYHPARIDPSSGATQYNTPLLIRRIPTHRGRDGTVWFVLLKAALFPEAKHTVGLLYTQILPFLNSRPVLANLPSSEASADANTAAAPSAAQGGPKPVQTRWWAPPNSTTAGGGGGGGGDPHGYQLVSLAAAVAIQLGAAGSLGPNGGMAPQGAQPGWASAPVYSADGLELLLKHQILVHATKDLTTAAKLSASSITASVLELLSRGTKRLSAHSPRLAAGASTLSPADLTVLRAHVLYLNTLLAQARDSMTTQQKPLPPPSGEVRGSALFPHLDKLAANPNIESLAGDDVEPPILMPVEITSVPDKVGSFSEVSNALQKAATTCTLLANQRGLVADSYALRFSLLSHLFLRVLPLPLPIGREDRKIRCFWARKDRDITHDTQAEILRWLSLLARHFAAASLSIPLAPTADATRIFVFAAITAIADACCAAPHAMYPPPSRCTIQGRRRGLLVHSRLR